MVVNGYLHKADKTSMLRKKIHFKMRKYEEKPNIYQIWFIQVLSWHNFVNKNNIPSNVKSFTDR